MKDRQLTFRITHSDYEYILKRAQEYEITMGEYLRKMVKQDIIKEDPDNEQE